MVAYEALPKSSYLDLTSYQGNAPLPTGTPLSGSIKINVALVLERANDPTALLEADWGARQKQLAALNESGSLWSTYGADKQAFDKVLDELDALGIPTFYDKDAPANGQYVSSAEARTIWVQVDETSFTKLFGPSAALRDGGTNALGDKVLFWEGNLSLPKAMVDAGVEGLWFDTGALETPIPADPGSGSAADAGTTGRRAPATRYGVASIPTTSPPVTIFPSRARRTGRQSRPGGSG